MTSSKYLFEYIVTNHRRSEMRMRKFLKFTWILPMILIIVFGLGSCKDESGAGASGNNRPTVVDDDVIFSPYVKTTLVLGEGIDERDVSAIRTAYYKAVGKEIAISTASVSSSHEIIVGKTDRPLSERAERYLTKFDEGEVGYVIYSDGRSVAISFDSAEYGENVAFAEAIDNFVLKFMQSDSLKLGSGAAYYASFDSIEKQKERDGKEIDRLWNLKMSQIAAKVSGRDNMAVSIVSALKDLRYIFTDDNDIVKWLANLYDPETGGFYYSASARNGVGYLPDLESTAQALGIVESILTGYGGTLTDYFGEEIAEGFVSFAKSMQDQNGYFYHPQWPRELVDKNQERRSRDVLNALNILELFGASPIYDTPNGVKGEGAPAPASRLALPLRESVVCAVSQLAESDSSEVYIPSHLKSEESFNTYLSGLSIRNDTAEVSETLLAETALYLRIDEMLEEQGERYRLKEMLLDYLSRNQNYSTGLWSSSNDITYDEVGEICSVIKIYNALGTMIPRYENIFSTIIRCAKFTEEIDNITDISGVWSAFAAVVKNITSYSHIALREEINGTLEAIYSNLDAMLRATNDKLSMFLHKDGSFSTIPGGGASESLGMPVAVPSSEEGDMNATLIAAKNIWLSIFGALDIGSVPIFTASDRMMFQKTLLDMGVIIKNEVKKTPPIDFEGTPLGSSSDVRHVIGSSDSKTEVVAGPESQGNVLNLYSSENSDLDQFFFDVSSSVKSASCYAYEFDMCVLAETSTGVFGSLYLYSDVYLISMDRVGDEIRFLEESSRSSSASNTRDLGVRVKVGEWFNLRVEYYPGTAETVRTKIYFNGMCVVASDNFFGAHSDTGVPSTDYRSFAVYGLKAKVLDVLIDDVVTEKTYMTYTQETSVTLNRNADTPDKSQKMHDFENSTVGAAPADFEFTGDSDSAVVRTDSDGNKVLSLNESIGEMILPLDQRGSGINSALIEFDLVVDASSAVGAKYQISFNEYLYRERTFAAMQLLVVSSGGNRHATLAEVVSGETGTPYSDVQLSLGVSYRVRLQLFFDEGALVVSIDGEIVGISSAVLDGCKRFYMGETAIESLTPSVSSGVTIDNLISERARSSFEEMTAPNVPRAEYGFDSSDGMTLSGVSPLDGVLSFAGAGTGESYVRIPVLTRVNVPTMALMGFDVISGDGAMGNLIISLSDKSGNIVAAFAIAKEAEDIKIYEYTKNGRYPTSIHTVSAPSFNFSVEYSAKNESFNLLVDGEYVAASSITYTENSGAYSFEYLTVSALGAVGISIDNLYAEEICGVFKAHKVSLPNTDSNGSTITYESSSFASMPTIIERILGGSQSYFRIKEAVIKDKVTKVLEMNCADMASATTAMIKTTETVSGSNAAYFETDIMLKCTTGQSRIMFEFQSREATAYSFAIEADSPGAQLRALGGSNGRDFTTALDVKEGEWFKLRVEYRDTPDDFNYDELNDCLFRAYVNGVLVGEGHSPTTLDKLQPALSIYRIRVRNVSGRIGKVYLDNSKLSQCTMTYTPPVPADKETITYEPGIITKKTQFNLASTSSYAKISEMTVASEVTKVLEFHTADKAEDILMITPTLTEDKANAVRFETDIMISPETDTAVFTLEPRTAGNNLPFRLTIKAYKGGDVTVMSSDIPETVIGKCGEWIHLKVDYMNPRADYTGDGRDDILVKIYAGDGADPVAVGYEPVKTAAYYDPKIIAKYILTTAKDTVADIFFDNTRFWLTVCEIDKAPEFEGVGDPYFNNSETEEFDGNGWT